MRHPNYGKFSDQQFITTWKELQSASAVSTRLGINVRNVLARRKAIEEKHSIVLPVFDTRSAYCTVGSDSSRSIVKLEIENGVVLIGSDIHIWPGQRTTMQRAFINFAERFKPVAVIANGDVFDGASISRHARIGWEHQPTVKQELEAVQDFMGDLTLAAGKAKRIWTLGNHDARFESRLAHVAPEYSGIKGIHLRDHFDQWIPAWRVDINGDVVVKHRGQGGEHADWNNTIKSGKTFVTGHDHRAGVVPYRDYNGTRWGVRCGYMAESPTDAQFVNYMEAGEPNWHPAFGVLSFLEGKLLQPEICWKWEHGENAVQFRGELIAC